MLPRFGTDGVRGLANAELTPEVALALARAAAEVLGGDRVVVGRDTRRSGAMLEGALVAGFAASGLDVSVLGVVPTPAVAWVAAAEGALGVVISASHNPFPDNGIKLFGPGGTKLTAAVEAAVERRLHQLLEGHRAPVGPTGHAVGAVAPSTAAAGWADAVAGSTDVTFDGLHVVLDAANGAAAPWAGRIFERLGARVRVVGDQPDGTNINDGVGSTAPGALARVVCDAGAQLGLALDGDADRLVAVDEAGDVVDGDHILAILAHDLRDRGALRHDAVVVTVMTNLGFHRAMADHGVTVIETPVGDRHVLAAIDAGGFSLGGEQSGHIILRDLASTGDGLLTAVALTAAMVRSGRALSQLRSGAMARVPQILRNVEVRRRDPGLVERLGPEVDEARSRMGSDGRVLLRPSGTEPLVRVMVECTDAQLAADVADDLVAAVRRAAEGPAGSNG